MPSPIRVLMSEGSSLSARESLTALGLAGFRVDVVDSNPLCLARFSRWPTRLHSSPKFGTDPRGYLHFVLDLLRQERFDVLYPAHEQAWLFARYADQIEPLTRLALPPFEVFERMQSKVAFARLLDELELPAPPTVIVNDPDALRRGARTLPVYVKTAFGTATQGTFCVRCEQDLELAVHALRDVFADGVLVQALVPGTLGRTQAVFAAGRLVGFHACLQIEEGVGGGDLIKESIAAPVVREHVERLGGHLQWHGGLSLDFILDAQGKPHYIDSNPRLAETGNGLAAGVNLPELLVNVSLGRETPGCRTGAPGVRTYMGIQGLLKSAKTGGRELVARTMKDLVERRGWFSRGSEELTPVGQDPRSLIPLALVGSAMLADPGSWTRFSSATINAYAAGPEVVRFIRNPRETNVSPSSSAGRGSAPPRSAR